MSASAPYAGLTPETVPDALEGAGLRGDGRLLALNSYENRVYQIFLEEGPPVVAKFYRPARCTDAQILEEHAFVTELAEREIPVWGRAMGWSSTITNSRTTDARPRRRCIPSTCLARRAVFSSRTMTSRQAASVAGSWL